MADISTSTQDKQRSALDALTQAAAQAQAAQAQQVPASDPTQATVTPDPTQASSVPPVLQSAISQPVQSTDAGPINQGDAGDRGTTDLEARADSPNAMAQDVAARSAIGSDADTTPGPAKESLLKKILKAAGGAVGYGDPSDPDVQKGSSIMGVMGRVGRGLAAAEGTPEQKQIAEEENKTDAELPLRLAAQQNLAAFHQGTLGVNQQKADQDADKIQAIRELHEQQAREKGYKTGPDGQLVPMSIDERLADPSLNMNDEQKRSLIMAKTAETQLAQAHQQAIANPNSPAFRQKEEAIQNTYKAAMARVAIADKMAELAGERLNNTNFRTNLAGSEAGLKIWGPAMDSGERLQVMRQNYNDALKNHDQQAMLSLLANHLGMTMGLQKGARINQAIIAEAQNSLPYLQGLQAKFDSDGYLTGVNLAPNQMKTMVALGENRYKADVQKARYQGEYAGVPEPQLPIDAGTGTEAPLPPPGPAKRVPLSTPSAPTKVPSFKDWKNSQGAQ